MQKLEIIQNTHIIGNKTAIGLAEIFLHQMQLAIADPFESVTIIVPNLTLANWLNDIIARELAISCNIEFVLLSKFIETIYLKNNPAMSLFQFEHAKYIIYNYLVTIQADDAEFNLIKNYLFKSGEIQRGAAFSLATQLADIFHEYIYLRTLDASQAHFTNTLIPWQKRIWQHLFKYIKGQKTYIDIYKFFSQSIPIKGLPQHLFIFGLNNIYPSQLDILQKLAHYIQINWYSQVLSNHYYGDLLSDKARLHLEHKILKAPELHLSDLYLIDGNALLANLGTVSREFNELLLANDIEVKKFTSMDEPEIDSQMSLLSLIQTDIRNIRQRIVENYRLQPELNCYAPPITLSDTSSIKVNVCYNRMREVQVIFNQILHKLENDQTLDLSEILITAPNIDDYVPYLNAVFQNEYALNGDGNSINIPYMITGNTFKNNDNIIVCLKLILNLPYSLPVSYFLELLNDSLIMRNQNLTAADCELVQKYLYDNHTHFGYDSNDYAIYGYQNFDINSFKRFLANLVLGACIPLESALDTCQLPVIHHANSSYAVYDNLENNQIPLCNKLIRLIELLVELRNLIYVNGLHYKPLSPSQLIECFNHIKLILLNDEADCLDIDAFIAYLKQMPFDQELNLPVINQIMDAYAVSFTTKVIFTGKVTCASMQAVAQIPYKAIYVLGLNFGEFPRNYKPNRLSILSKEWTITDRNLNLEDKQLFLNIVLAAKEHLCLSYIGRNQYDNQVIEPSPILKLLLDTIQNSLIDGPAQLQQIITVHSLQPFYNNNQLNYSVFWQQISTTLNKFAADLRWDFQQNKSFKLSLQQEESWKNPDLTRLINTFLYTNHNLYGLLRISTYPSTTTVDDFENFELLSYATRKNFYQAISNTSLDYTSNDKQKKSLLASYLALKGITAYSHIGEYQFETLLNLYLAYRKLYTGETVNAAFYSPKYNLSLDAQFNTVGNSLIVVEDFMSIRAHSQEMQAYKINYKLKVKCLIYYLMSCFATFTDQKEHILKIDKVYLRLISIELRQIEYAVELHSGIDAGHLWGEILRLYQYSLTNPLLVHSGAIEAYIDAIPEQKVSKARQVYSNTYQNKELDALVVDPIFATIATDYFNPEIYSGVNTICWIGDILNALKLTEVRHDDATD